MSTDNTHRNWARVIILSKLLLLKLM